MKNLVKLLLITSFTLSMFSCTKSHDEENMSEGVCPVTGKGAKKFIYIH